MLLLGAYLLSINTASAYLFYHDKQQAIHHNWRIPEKTLQLSALIGGWIGGFWAMNKFHHKTKKQEFLIPYYLCVAGNMVGLGYFYRPMAKPITVFDNNKFKKEIQNSFRRVFSKQFNQTLRQIIKFRR